jgi:hypothetical protein
MCTRTLFSPDCPKRRMKATERRPGSKQRREENPRIRPVWTRLNLLLQGWLDDQVLQGRRESLISRPVNDFSEEGRASRSKGLGDEEDSLQLSEKVKDSRKRTNEL